MMTIYLLSWIQFIAPKNRYKTIVDIYAANIRSGQLAAGERLPTHRELAKKESIALVTASRVYLELEEMGLISGEIGRGTFVREIGLPFGHGIDQIATSTDMMDLSFNYPTLPNQTDLLRNSLRKLASSGDLESLLRYQPHAGRRHERTIIAKHLLKRGLNVDAEQISIVSGAQHGLACTAIALLNPGDVVAVDALTYPGFKVVAEAHHLEIVPIPMTEQGPDLDALLNLCQTRNIRAVYTMPTLHNPMGWVMCMEQREKLASIAKKQNLIIIEDAAYAYLAENPPPPIASLATDNTIYVSGFSKNIATGLRIGFVVTPLKWLSNIERSIRATTWNTPALITAITCSWIEDGTVDLLEKEKHEDAKKRQAIAREIFKESPHISHASSYFLWLPLPEEVRADKIVLALAKLHISISTAEPFSTSEHFPQAIRLALGSVELQQLVPTLKIVKQVIDLHSDY
ncbi:MAG: PLP-dependent aminotransferase family protein [Marinomonas colpomeniae]